MENSTLKRVGEFMRPTPLGQFYVVCYMRGQVFAFAVMKGRLPADNLLVRVQSPCLFGESFFVNSCDCGAQLSEALKIGAAQENFLLLYLADQEGRGHGMLQKIQAIQEEVDKKLDMVQAFESLHLPLDIRDYKVAAEILYDLN